MSPTLALILRRAAGQAGLDPVAVVGLRPDPERLRVQQLYCWLALELTERSLPAIGLTIGQPPAIVRAHRQAVDKDRASDPKFRGQLDELALELQAEAGVIERLGLTGEPDRDPQAIAVRILSSRRLAMGVNLVELTTLATAFQALERSLAALSGRLAEAQSGPLARHVAEFLRAEDKLVKDRMTPFERGARLERDRALQTLTSLVAPAEFAS